MDFIQRGIYTYSNGLSITNNNLLPTEMIISDRISNEALLIRMLCGTLNITYDIAGHNEQFSQTNNYAVPGVEENQKYKKSIIQGFFSFDHFRANEKESIDKYLRLNRRNHFVHSELLSELSSAVIWMENSPIEAFVHIYRALEFMSYSFPLIYASKSMDYRGSYRELKKFMSGNSDGELSFLRIFLKELFQDKLIYDFVFEIYFMDGNETLIQEELERVIKHNYYTFEGNTMKIKFMNVVDLIIDLRNRFFHMLLGIGSDNFYDIRYDKRSIFCAMNPVFVNWLTLVYREIVIYSLEIV